MPSPSQKIRGMNESFEELIRRLYESMAFKQYKMERNANRALKPMPPGGQVDALQELMHPSVRHTPMLPPRAYEVGVEPPPRRTR